MLSNNAYNYTFCTAVVDSVEQTSIKIGIEVFEHRGSKIELMTTPTTDSRHHIHYLFKIPIIKKLLYNKFHVLLWDFFIWINNLHLFNNIHIDLMNLPDQLSSHNTSHFLAKYLLNETLLNISHLPCRLNNWRKLRNWILIDRQFYKLSKTVKKFFYKTYQM